MSAHDTPEVGSGETVGDASWALDHPSLWESPDARSAPTLLAAVGQELRAIRLLLEENGMCPHGDRGVCMSCVRDLDIGWSIGQAVKGR